MTQCKTDGRHQQIHDQYLFSQLFGEDGNINIDEGKAQPANDLKQPIF